MIFEQFAFKHLRLLADGLLVTLRVCGITLLMGSVVGLLVGIALTSRNKALSGICKAYVNLIRGVPLLIILFMVFYGIPLMANVDVSQSAASIWSLTIYAGAYIAEIVRGSIESIPKGQTEAAQALGMSVVQRMRIVILPQAFRMMIPPLVGFFIALIKDSSLVSAIGYIDLTRAGKVAGNLTINPLLSFFCVAVFYFAVCFSLSKLSQFFEKKLQCSASGGNTP